MSRRWLGIDFSGNHRMWGAGVRRSNIWVADVALEDNALGLSQLWPVQKLSGAGPPFERLTALLRAREFDAAAIDAPFSVPERYLPAGGHRRLIQQIGRINRKGRLYPTSIDFVFQVVRKRTLEQPKPLRETENYWKGKGVNVRSTLWAGPRPGAAMTSACLVLLHAARCPIWPWRGQGMRGLLVEAFPAAQLRHWDLPYQGYSKPTRQAKRIREQITDFVSKLMWLGSHRGKMEESPDALDAVLCSFAAIAVTTNCCIPAPRHWPRHEGRIAVHTKLASTD